MFSMKKKIKREFERGRKNAEDFLKSNPSHEDIVRHWSQAECCEYFDNDSLSRAYDQGYKEVLNTRYNF